MACSRAEAEQEVRESALQALKDLRKLREENRALGYPSVDAVELVRQGREELEHRSDHLWPS